VRFGGSRTDTDSVARIVLAIVLVGGGAWAVAVAGGTAIGPDPGIVETSATPGAPLAGEAVLEGEAVPETEASVPSLAARVPSPRARARVEELLRAPGWLAFLGIHHRLPPAGAAGEIERLRTVHERAEHPVVRQNAIALATLLSPGDAEPWLRALADGADADDAEDALVFLAFGGDESAVARFEALARRPSDARVRRLVCEPEIHEALAHEDGARAMLRSYRAVEVLDREPYFKRSVVLVRRAPWAAHAMPVPSAVRRRLHVAWLARWPGHPGSDDLAVRVARAHADERDAYEAARWYGRAAILPDQDVIHGALRGLLATAETALSLDEVARLAREDDLAEAHGEVLDYVRLRRLAVGRGFGVAVREAARRRATSASERLAHAWTTRLCAPPCRGLDSGVVPLPADDPLRTVAAAPPPGETPTVDSRPRNRVGGVYDRYDLWREDAAARLDPPRPAFSFDAGALRRQFRAWETLAELEERAERAHGDARADLLYKQAAILHHDPNVVFPVHVLSGSYTGGFLRHDGTTDEEQADAAMRRFQAESFASRRAILVFERIRREHPGYAGMDSVLYSVGVSWRRLIDHRALASTVREEDTEDWTHRHEMARRLVAAFEELALHHRESPLAPAAADAARWWRRRLPDAFR
jgi:hypothetical protein